MRDLLGSIVLAALLLPAGAPSAPAQVVDAAIAGAMEECRAVDFAALGRNPTPAELRCRYGAFGPGRFGLLSYRDVPVYQPRTPLPGTHVVGEPGMPAPAEGESFEAWEWRVLRTEYGPEAQRVRDGLELLDPITAGKIMRFERLLADAGVRFGRRETWRAPERQGWLFQQGRSREGGIVTATLTSCHNAVDPQGQPASRAVDYDVAPADMRRFHEIARSAGLATYGPDSHDPGHVYDARHEWPSRGEVALLRLLPRVPHVTLATGRPVDERVTPGQRRALRERSFAFAANPLPGVRVAAVVGGGSTPPIVAPPAVARSAAPVARRR